MAMQCLVSAILHQPTAESSTSVEGGLQQLKYLVSPMKGLADEAKCEDLEKFAVSDDLEKFFQVRAQLPP